MINKQKQPDIAHTLSEMDGGLLEKTLSMVAAQVAIGVIEHGRKGKLTLTLDFEQIGESSQLMITHKIASTKPTTKGKITEEATTDTPMYTNMNGYLSIVPDAQIDMFSNELYEEQ